MPADRPSAIRPTSHPRHILVVDDEPNIVTLVRDVFERRGHRVSASSSAVEALGWIRKGERFDIVVTDQTMPEITGIELARTIAERMPGAKVLLCSGRDDMIDQDEIAAANVAGFAPKPFNLIELVETVDSLLRDAAAVG